MSTRAIPVRVSWTAMMGFSAWKTSMTGIRECLSGFRERFTAANQCYRAVGDDCNNLFAGYFVCIGLTTSPTEIPMTGSASATAAAVTGPSPEQTGIPSNCKIELPRVGCDGCELTVSQAHHTTSCNQEMAAKVSQAVTASNSQTSTPGTRPSCPIAHSCSSDTTSALEFPTTRTLQRASRPFQAAQVKPLRRQRPHRLG